MTAKKMTAGLLALSMIFSGAVLTGAELPLSKACAEAEEEEQYKTCEGFIYSVESDGTVTIRNYNGDAETLVIPSEIEGKPVTAIGHYYPNLDPTAEQRSEPVVEGHVVGEVIMGAFEHDHPGIKTIILPDTVTALDSNFIGCDDLESIEFGSGITEIPFDCCGGLKKLSEVKIKLGVTRIGNQAFDYCPALKELHLPASVEDIGNRAFGFKNGLTDEVYDDFTLYCTENSAAKAYAEKNGINYVLEDKPQRAAGDITWDGRLDTKDAMKSVAFAKKTSAPKSEDEFAAADVNSVSRLDSKDAMMLINAVKNKTAL